MSTTSQINADEFTRVFEPVLQGGEDVLYIAFSSGLSGTCQSAFIARDELKEKYPERKIYVFDSLCASLGEGLLVYHAAMLKRAGTDIDSLYKWLGENVLKLCHWFTVDDLNHLKRGGRVSATAALVGTLLGVKPVLHVDDEGHLIPVSKVRGRRGGSDRVHQPRRLPGRRRIRRKPRARKIRCEEHLYQLHRSCHRRTLRPRHRSAVLHRRAQIKEHILC